MTNEQMQNKILDWLKGYLSDSESAEMKTRAENDPDFASLVEQERLLMQALDRLGQKALRPKIARWRNDLDNIPPSPKFDETTLPDTKLPDGNPFIWLSQVLKYPVWVRILFGILLIGALGLILWLNRAEERPPSNPSPPPVIPRNGPVANDSDKQGENAEQPQPFNSVNLPPTRTQLAMSFHQPEYPSKNYVKTPENRESKEISNGIRILKLAQDTLKKGFPRTAIALLNGIAPADSLETDVQLWRGHALFKNGKYEDAISAYRLYEELTIQTDHAEWYLLLSYLATYPNHKQEFNDLLAKVTGDPGHTFFQQALSLQKQLKQGARE